MKITAHKSQIRTIRKNDPRFLIKDGMVIAQRAGFEISDNCPEEYKRIIIECIGKGWLNPVATMTERELLFIGLGSN